MVGDCPICQAQFLVDPAIIAPTLPPLPNLPPPAKKDTDDEPPEWFALAHCNAQIKGSAIVFFGMIGLVVIISIFDIPESVSRVIGAGMAAGFIGVVVALRRAFRDKSEIKKHYSAKKQL